MNSHFKLAQLEPFFRTYTGTKSKWVKMKAYNVRTCKRKDEQMYLEHEYGHASVHHDTIPKPLSSMAELEHINVLPSGERKGKRKEGKRTQRLKTHLQAGRCWCTPLILALGRQRQANLCEFEASLVYKS